MFKFFSLFILSCVLLSPFANAIEVGDEAYYWGLVFKKVTVIEKVNDYQVKVQPQDGSNAFTVDNKGLYERAHGCVLADESHNSYEHLVCEGDEYIRGNKYGTVDESLEYFKVNSIWGGLKGTIQNGDMIAEGINAVTGEIGVANWYLEPRFLFRANRYNVPAGKKLCRLNLQFSTTVYVGDGALSDDDYCEGDKVSYVLKEAGGDVTHTGTVTGFYGHLTQVLDANGSLIVPRTQLSR